MGSSCAAAGPPTRQLLDRDACHHGPVTGSLIVAATPIGNPDDASPRLAAAMAGADVVAAEDTRRLARLARELGVAMRGDVVSFYESVEAARLPGLLRRLAAGDTVLLVTDAGMPSVSDPGYTLVSAAVAAGQQVTVIPGPSAVLAALAVSGLPCDRFCFEGFPPRRAGERARWLAALAVEPRAVVFFESPHRIEATLIAAAHQFGADRRAAVCRELTKTYEEVVRGTLGELAQWAAGGVLGEITVVVAGAPPTDTTTGTPAEWAAAVAGDEASGLSRKEAIKAASVRFGVPKREVFDAVVAQRTVPPA